MASFNTNSAPSPFGVSSATPTPDIGAQFFLGCTVVDFNINADWSSQGGSLSVTIIEDTDPGSNLDYNSSTGAWTLGSTYVQKLRDTAIYDYATGTYGSLPVIGSPQHFRLLDTGGNIVFQYDGILKSISRSATPSNGKKYVVELGSPLSLLEKCSMVLNQLPGYGHAIEGTPYGMSINGYYSNATQIDPYYFGTSTELDKNINGLGQLFSNSLHNEIYDNTSPGTFAVEKNFTNQDVGPTFGTNNAAIDWANVYNLQNVFGIYENESDGISGYAKFGASRSSGDITKDQGLRLDMVAFALDELINRNPSSNSSKKKFGGNIISGTTTYNFYDVAVGNVAANPYFFGFDVYSFTDFMINKLGADYVYTGNISSNVLEFVSTLCNDAGVDFIIELNRIQTSNVAGTNYWDGTDTVSNYSCPGSLYNGGTFHLQKSYANSVPGGIISVKVLDRRTLSITDPANIRTPFSKVAYHILGYESPDFGDKGSALMNPGDPNPFSNAFEIGAFGNTYLDPLDDDFTLKGTDGSSPYGGNFPVAKTTDMNQADDPNDIRLNASQTNIKIQDNQQVSAKFVVGGKQSRIVTVPREYIYQYWGQVKVTTVERGYGIEPEFRSMPVITPFLEEDDIVDFIMIDMKGALDREDGTFNNILTTDGIYVASVFEIRAAMKSYKDWEEFFFTMKSCAIYGFLESIGYAADEISKIIKSVAVFNVDSNGLDVNSPNRKSEEQEDSPRETPQQKDDDGTSVSSSDRKIFWEMLVKIHEKIKNIGDEHYGKSWVVWTPQATANLADGYANLGSYDFSWSPASDAYLEPSVYDELDAPISQNFLNGNRVNGWTWYPTQVGDTLISRNRNLQGAPPNSSDTALNKNFEGVYDATNNVTYDFSRVGEDSIFQTKIEKYTRGTTHVKPSIDEDFVFVPYDYFKYYARDRKMFFDLRGDFLTPEQSFYTIDYSDHNAAVNYPGIAIDSGYDIYAQANILSKSGQSIVGNSVLPSAIDYLKYDACNSGVNINATKVNLSRIMCEAGVPTDYPAISLYEKAHINNAKLIEDFSNLAVPDHGLNCITFTKIRTPFIGLPPAEAGSPSEYKMNLSVSTVKNALLNTSNSQAVTPSPDSKKNESAPKLINLESTWVHPPCVGPWGAGIPQQSSRHHYGPWFTTHNFIYGGKVEYIQDDELVPENHIYPIYGSLTSSDSNSPVFSGQLSGFAGMNLAGQSIANSLDGYGQFAAEDGSVTIPGAPVISRIGDALFTNGPYVTSMSVSAGAKGITTKYVFNSVTSRAGKTNNDIVKKIQRVSGKINSYAGNKKGAK